MRMMLLFCMARVAVAVAGLAVMAYVALGCTWAAIEETAPIADADDGACLRVKNPLIAPGECLTGIEPVKEVKFSGLDWVDTNIAIPESEWWLVSPAGAGYTVVSTAALHDLDEQSASDRPGSNDDLSDRVRKSIYIPGPGITTTSTGANSEAIQSTRNWYVLLGRNDHELLVWSEQAVDVQIYRVVAAPTVTE